MIATRNLSSKFSTGGIVDAANGIGEEKNEEDNGLKRIK